MGFTDHESGINTSYVFGIDDKDGWGPRYFFTFYTEFGNREFEMSAEICLLSIIFILSMGANLFVLITVMWYPALQTVTNYFLLNLTAADILFCLSIPGIMYARVSPQWPLGDVLCKIMPYSQFVCGFVLLWTLTLISMDRYFCIVVPPYRSKLTPHRVLLLTLGTWFIACVVFVPVVLWFREQEVLESRLICTIVFPNVPTVSVSTAFTVVMVVLACLLPLALLVYYYCAIFRKLVETKKKWEHSHLSSHHARHTRVMRMLCISVCVILAMWLPIFLTMILIYIDGRRPTADTEFFLRSHHFLWPLLLALANTVVNPLLFGALSENFLGCLTKRKRLLDTSAPSVARIS
ncbi:neuropeptide Y receptor type 2 [Diaphorina citri]|uniref:Neuropeptide Y receptor type 2 n=1 Tax=Diaphorina citri TaxID=121845 RepID=A0A1S3DK97_DIACI|nr:neuropeptide Y receptor type 2 [Diaphorina citri]XP_026687286.1 neuropeptide Y receptor type 2 [Diaphorina citri]